MKRHSAMEWSKWPSLTGLSAGTILLSRTVPTTFALDKPIHSSIGFLATAGVVILAVSRFLPRDGAPAHESQDYEAIPLADVRPPRQSQEHSPPPNKAAYPSSLRKLRIVFLILLATLVFRVEALRKSLANSECASVNLAPLIPIVFAMWDFWSVQRNKRYPKREDDMSDSMYDALERYFVQQPYPYVIAVSLTSLGGLLALNAIPGPASTFICTTDQSQSWYLHALPFLSFISDIILIWCIVQLLQQQDGRGHRSIALRFASVGWSSIVSSIVLLAVSLVHVIFLEQGSIVNSATLGSYLSSVMWFVVLATFTFVCTLFAIRHVGIMTTTVLIGFLSTATITTSMAWTNLHPFPPTNFDQAYFGICVAMLAFAIYFHIETLSGGGNESTQRIIFAKMPGLFYLALTIFFFLWVGLWASHKDVVNFHPIDMLIFEANQHHESYLERASSSETIAQAVDTYKDRYQRYPPPGFDAWYEFATERTSIVIDSYDTIYRDLLPFYSLSPSDIRQRTWDLVSNPANSIMGVSIREGKATIMSENDAYPQWMTDGILELIDKFSEKLPDMDLAFNLNQEPRVVVPFEDLQSMLPSDANMALPENPEKEYSAGRKEQWKSLPDTPNQDTPFPQAASETSFFEFSSVACPLNSPARNQRIRNMGELCVSCSYPQSLGVALSDWELAADICHQPDLVNLHEAYSSRAAVNGTHTLYPVFSNSKLYGFNDILYPSPWDYLEKTRYAPNDEFQDPEFSNKKDVLFWRGELATDSLPSRNLWKGMSHQRFVQLANKVEKPKPKYPLLLPEPISPQAGKLTYVHLPTSQLRQIAPVDVQYVGFTEACSNEGDEGHDGGDDDTKHRDCAAQEAEFGPPSPPADFQSHWQYKYLLDLDGTGPSRSFLPFLRSRAVPLKSSVWYEWWHDRLTPWRDFLPLDIRGHGFWATLVYFTGVDADILGHYVKVDAHVHDAERIAEHGRDWAGKVLRRADMEIYFYRLLLEWARLTDDRRDSLGFDVERKE